MGFPIGSVVKNMPTNAEDHGSIPGSGRFTADRNGSPLQYSCLENSMDRGACCGLQSVRLQRVGHDLVTKEQQTATQCYISFGH